MITTRLQLINTMVGADPTLARKVGDAHESRGYDGQCFEWWKEERKLTVYLDDDPVILKIWGADIDMEMEDLPLTKENVVKAWLWLHTSQ